jgi:Cu-Zn family superoxide dismutase
MPVLASVIVKIYATDDLTKDVGTVTITETPYGLLFSPQLTGLVPGVHGFHIHQNPSCDDHGMSAGGHYDPKKTDKHLGPYNDKGHLGDLPALYVNSDGSVSIPVLAPRLKSIATIKNHALMVHEGGDTYSDVPNLGGGGTRMECGLII